VSTVGRKAVTVSMVRGEVVCSGCGCATRRRQETWKQEQRDGKWQWYGWCCGYCARFGSVGGGFLVSYRKQNQTQNGDVGFDGTKSFQPALESCCTCRGNTRCTGFLLYLYLYKARPLALAHYAPLTLFSSDSACLPWATSASPAAVVVGDTIPEMSPRFLSWSCAISSASR
jgi:hypothetical protein